MLLLVLILILISVLIRGNPAAFQHQRIYIRRSIGIKETIPDASGSERHLFI
jgi:hypothetical protein